MVKINIYIILMTTLKYDVTVIYDISRDYPVSSFKVENWDELFDKILDDIEKKSGILVDEFYKRNIYNKSNAVHIYNNTYFALSELIDIECYLEEIFKYEQSFSIESSFSRLTKPKKKDITDIKNRYFKW